MSRDRDVKKSNFSSVSSSQATDTFDLVRNGQNLKITQANLITDFGATGPLQSLGELAATPVLTVISDVNYIRNILGGAGILPSISPQNGVQLDHNFTVDATGEAIMINASAASPTLRSLVAGAGITLTSGGTYITLSTTESSKTVIVYSESDFPTAVAGVITFADDTEYLIQNDISTSNSFVFGQGSVLKGADGTLINLEYVGSGTMFTAVDKNIKMKNLYLKCNSGTLFDISSTTGAHFFRLYESGCECLNVGTFTKLAVLVIFNTYFYSITGTGLTLAGNFSIVLLMLMGMVIPSGSGNAVDLGTSTCDAFNIDKLSFIVNSSGYCISGLASSGNINAGGSGAIFNVFQSGTAGLLNNISPYDDLWEMIMNSQIPDSVDLALATNSGTTVTISASATPVVIGASWVSQETHRFTAVATGRWTYNGKGAHCAITCNISADLATGTDDVSFFFYLNGVQIAASKVTREFTAGNVGNITMLWATELETSDYIEVWVQNDDTSVNVDIINATLRIRS